MFTFGSWSWLVADVTFGLMPRITWKCLHFICAKDHFEVYILVLLLLFWTLVYKGEDKRDACVWLRCLCVCVCVCACVCVCLCVSLCVSVYVSVYVSRAHLSVF